MIGGFVHVSGALVELLFELLHFFLADTKLVIMAISVNRILFPQHFLLKSVFFLLKLTFLRLLPKHDILKQIIRCNQETSRISFV